MYKKISLILVSLLACNAVLAETSGGGPVSGPVNGHAVTAADWLQMILGLGFVLLMIAVIAFVLRRISGPTSMNAGHLKILSILPVGTRERIALIQAGKEQIVVGITPQGITRIHALNEPVDVLEPAQPEFARRLQAMLNRNENAPADQRAGEDHAG